VPVDMPLYQVASAVNNTALLILKYFPTFISLIFGTDGV